jgi:hypothetical protein
MCVRVETNTGVQPENKKVARGVQAWGPGLFLAWVCGVHCRVVPNLAASGF